MTNDWEHYAKKKQIKLKRKKIRIISINMMNPETKGSAATPLSKYKLVFLGDTGVGKTSIINRFMFDTFDGKDHVILNSIKTILHKYLIFLLEFIK